MNGNRCRVMLISFSHCWIPTQTGAFSPAFETPGTPIQIIVDSFHETNSSEAVIYEDIRLEPRCAKHPGIAGRPNMRFFCGIPLVSRGHLVGTLHVWDSKVRPTPPPEKIEQFRKLGDDVLEALQQDMFECLEANSADARATMELPVVYLDLSTPRWQILGANRQWEKLKGITISDMARTQGLLDIMTPRDEPSLLRALAATERSPGVSVPVIISPCAPKSSTLEFTLALKPFTGHTLPKGVLMSPVAAATGGDIWIAEVHARVQAAAYSRSSCKPLISAFCGPCSGSDGASTNATSTHSTPPWTSIPSGSGSRAIHRLHTSTSGPSGPRIRPSSDSVVPTMFLMGSLGSVAGFAEVIVPPRLGTLQLGPLLGRGSYGSVYLGTLHGFPVAIKMITIPEGPLAAAQVWAAQYEIIVASDLSHENLVPTIDWCSYSDEFTTFVWIVQELCDRGSLSTTLQSGFLNYEKGTVPDLRAVLEIALDIARGMAYLHQHSLVHGDLSSNNVLFCLAENYRGYTAKVTDFGLSRELGGEDLPTKTVGTCAYTAPELLAEGLLGQGGDVYSFGVLLHEMFTGKRAWEGMSQAQVIFAVTCRNERLKMPKDCPEAYAQLAMECMAEERVRRPTFDEIVPRIEGVLAEFF